jgi:hypothetical protein
MKENQMLNIKIITINAGTQPRAEINQETVDDYARQMEEGAKFPPVIVFNDGIHHYLADGFHRYFAHLKLDKAGILADVIAGTLRDAKLYSYKANMAHGLRPTAEDKRKIVLDMLQDSEWSKWSDREIARHCGVSHPFVGKLRASLENPHEETRKYQDNKGSVRERTVNKRTPMETLPPEIKGDEVSEADVMVDTLLAENDKLKEQLAIASIDGTTEDKDMAKDLITELKEEIRLTKIELVAVTRSRDTFQSENAQLKRQVAMLQKKLKKYE